MFTGQTWIRFFQFPGGAVGFYFVVWGRGVKIRSLSRYVINTKLGLQ